MNEKQAIELLKKYSNNKKTFDIVLSHSKLVQKIALRIAGGVHGVNINFIKIAALLHDIGRFKCPPGKLSVRHGLVGATILKKEGLDGYALVAERHLGAGISKEDIIEQGLNLPLKDYVPVSNEEKIITHADNLASGDKEITFKEAIERYKKELGKKVADKIKKLGEEIELMKN